MALRVVKPTAADLEPIPDLKQAAQATHKILTTVQSVRENKADFQQLADNASGFIAKIWKSYQEIPDSEKADWPPQELRNVMRELVVTLKSILGFIQERVGRNTAVRAPYGVAKAKKIQEYRERLAAAMSQFEELDKMRSRLIEAAPQRLAEDETTRKIEELHRPQQTEKDLITEEKHPQKVEIHLMTAEEREPARRSRDEEKVRVETDREEDKIRITHEETELQRNKEAERDPPRLAEIDAKKHKQPGAKHTKTSGKMKAQVEEDDGDETVVHVSDSEESEKSEEESEESEEESEESEEELEEESEEESEDKAALEAARLAEEEARKAARNKKTKKTIKAKRTPTSGADNASANMNMGPTPPPNHPSTPPMFPPYPQQAYPPYGTPSPYGSPCSSPPLMGPYPGFYGQFPPSYPPGPTVNNAPGGQITMSNFNNNNTTNTLRRKKKAAH